MTRKKKKLRSPDIPHPPTLGLTPETVALLAEALACLEYPLSVLDRRENKAAFAQETLTQVRAKLETLRHAVGLTIAFDYNEKIILIAALQLYCLLLQDEPGPVQQRQKIQRCQYLAAYFLAENHHPSPGRA